MGLLSPEYYQELSERSGTQQYTPIPIETVPHMTDSAILFLLSHYFVVGFLFSLFYGIFAEKMFVSKSNRVESTKEFGRWVRIREFWLNFVGAAAGWFSLYLFIVGFQEVGAAHVSFNQIILLIMGVIGIVGWLPYTLSGVIQSLAAATKRLIDKI
jgi:hypothetical protein